MSKMEKESPELEEKKRRFLDLYYFLMINGKKIINPYFAR